MKTIKKKFELGEKEYLQKHFQIVSVLLNRNLSFKECEILACFVIEYSNLKEEDIFNSLARKRVMVKLNLTHSGLANHLKSIIDKGLLSKNPITNRITLRQDLLPEPDKNGYIISIIKV